MTEQDDLLTTEEVATELRVSRETVRHWLRTGVLSGRHVGPRTWRVKRADLVRFLETDGVKP